MEERTSMLNFVLENGNETFTTSVDGLGNTVISLVVCSVIPVTGDLYLRNIL